jgi:hypothetical protein
MAKVSERERIQALEAKLKQLKVVQQRREAKARSVETRRTRREEMRRKFLVGAIVLAKIEDGSLDRKILNGWLQTALTKNEDRALFELDGQA